MELTQPTRGWWDPVDGFRRGDMRQRAARTSALSGMQAVIHLAAAIDDAG